MGLTKREIHAPELNALADFFRTLGHPARLAMLQRIGASDTCICTDLSRELGLAQATISQHLKELKAAGLIRGSIEGNAISYCINAERVRQLMEQIDTFMEPLLKAQEGEICC